MESIICGNLSGREGQSETFQVGKVNWRVSQEEEEDYDMFFGVESQHGDMWFHNKPIQPGTLIRSSQVIPSLLLFLQMYKWHPKILRIKKIL